MSAPTTTVATTSGFLDVHRAGGLVHARGVPYATAERFGAPVPIDTPDVLRDATRRGPMSLQDTSRFDPIAGPILDGVAQDEDCLVVSVVAPQDAVELPVMVWFHGGSYMTGGGEAAAYDPDDLAREGVVVVNVTYRLGVLGYLAPEGNPVHNLGLRDQLEALRWVAANVAAFGGDPARVTAFGQSAGGDSILALLATEDGPRLFQRGIVQSSPHGLVGGRGGLTRVTREAITDDLRTAPMARVAEAQRQVIAIAERHGATGGVPFAPEAGVAPLPPDRDAALAGIAPGVELLVGYARDDAAAFVALDRRAAPLGRLGRIGRLIQRQIAKPVTASIFGIDAFVSLWRGAGGRVATYRFDWAPPGGPMGACHCIELPVLFSGDWSEAPMLAGQSIPADLSAELRRTWAAFARDGLAGLPSQSLTFG